MLVVVLVAVTYFMSFMGELELSASERFELFMAGNGWLKIGVLLIVAAIYPYCGFVKREVEGDIVENRDQIIVAMETSGFSLKEDAEGRMVFRANTIFRRVAFLFEDAIVVTQNGGSIHIEGVRRGVVFVVYCLDGFIKNSKRGE